MGATEQSQFGAHRIDGVPFGVERDRGVGQELLDVVGMLSRDAVGHEAGSAAAVTGRDRGFAVVVDHHDMAEVHVDCEPRMEGLDRVGEHHGSWAEVATDVVEDVDRDSFGGVQPTPVGRQVGADGRAATLDAQCGRDEVTSNGQGRRSGADHGQRARVEIDAERNGGQKREFVDDRSVVPSGVAVNDDGWLPPSVARGDGGENALTVRRRLRAIAGPTGDGGRCVGRQAKLLGCVLSCCDDLGEEERPGVVDGDTMGL